MELTLETLQHITTGAVSVTQEDGWFCFHRFSQNPKVYFEDAGFQAKVTATASVTLDFITDARQLSFQYQATRASSRSLFFFDLYVNDVLVTTHGCADAGEYLRGEFCRSLPAGENHIRLYFSNLYAIQLKDISLEGATQLRPAHHSRSMICFGDSITQGYDAVHPSLTYANRLAFSLNAKMINKGIGGDIFHPELIDDSDLNPDIVTVGYGTNDWAHSDRSTFLHNAETFLTRVRRFYPEAQVFVITPIWRTDCDRITDCGKFEDVAAALKTICRSLSNVHIIDGLSLAAHTGQMLTDHVHPDDLGHFLYGTALSTKVTALLHETPAPADFEN